MHMDRTDTGPVSRPMTMARAAVPPRSSAHRVWAPGTAGTLALATIVTGLPLVLHLMGPAFGIAACMLLAAVVVTFAVSTVPTALLFAYLFQNLFVALVSPVAVSADQLNVMRGYNFILTVATWIMLATPFWVARAGFDRDFRRLIDVTTAMLVVVGLYFVLGLAANPGGAIVYLRNLVAPLLLFQVFALVAYDHKLSLTGPFTAMASIALTYGYLEFFAHDQLHALVNGDFYLALRAEQENQSAVWLKELHENGWVIRSYRDMLMIDFLNTPFLADLGLRFYRILGPNFHFISYAYALAFFSIVLFAAGRWWYALLALPMLLIVGSKGALTLVLMIMGLAVLLRLRGPAPVWIYIAMLLLYATVGIVVGMGQDYHVIGFIGGLKGFLANPIGRGLGVGGNLSLDMTTIDWSKSQYLGHTDIAVESAVGVLLYQMGVFGVVLLAVLVWIAFRLWRWYRESANRLYAVGCLGLLTIIVNGIFQEEALFAPLAIGTVLAFAGLLLGRARRLPMPREASA
jgi:hypothetical protein